MESLSLAPTSTRRYSASTRHTLLLIVSTAIFLVLVIIGDYGPHLMANNLCYKYLGCNAGFFGYDVLVHFFSGMTEVVFILWLARGSAYYDIFHNNGFWKNFLILMGICALIGVSWEIVEFSYDHFRMDVLHMNLIHPNLLAQPSNADTMGDLTMGLIGAAFAAGISKLFAPEIVWRKTTNK